MDGPFVIADLRIYRSSTTCELTKITTSEEGNPKSEVHPFQSRFLHRHPWDLFRHCWSSFATKQSWTGRWLSACRTVSLPLRHPFRSLYRNIRYIKRTGKYSMLSSIGLFMPVLGMYMASNWGPFTRSYEYWLEIFPSGLGYSIFLCCSLGKCDFFSLNYSSC